MIDRGERLESSFSRYRERYFKPTHQVSEHIFNWELRDGSEEKIYERIEDICLSMKAKDFLNMPERIDTKQTVALSDKERKVYEELEKLYFRIGRRRNSCSSKWGIIKSETTSTI